MAKIRVGEIAKELNLKLSETLVKLRKLGVTAKSGLNMLETADAARLRAAVGGTKATGAARTRTTSGKRAAGSATAGAVKKKKKTAKAPASARPAAKTASAGKPATTARPKTTVAGKRSKVTPARPAAAKKSTEAGRPRTTTAPSAATRGPGVVRKPVARLSPAPTAVRRVSPGVRPPVGGVRPTAPGARQPASGARTPLTAVRPAMPAKQPPDLAARPQSPAAPVPPAAVRPTIPGPVPPRTGQAAPATTAAATPPAAPARPRPGFHRAPAGRSRQMRSRGAPPRPVPAAMRPAPVMPPIPDVLQDITITEGVTVKELSEKMSRKAKDIITRLLSKGIMATINQPLDTERAITLCREFGYDAKVVSFEEEVAQDYAEEVAPEKLRTRDPIVTIMGHVDHGKTSLLDSIRKSNIVSREAGGITQHIGAYHIRHKNRGITFIDTPGHEAFTMMRARGARVTDIVILMVAADDGVMPQTVEAIDHARAANVPIIVAINKIDKPGANLDRVKKQLADRDLLVEDWGGKIVAVPISAKEGTGIDDLLEMILLVAEMADPKADPESHAAGTVLEAKLDRARGPVATVIVQRGTLRVGDPFIAGAVHGKVRAMFDEGGHRVKEVGPSIPAEVLGLERVPRAGDTFQVLADEWRVRQIGAFRQQKLRHEAMTKTSRLTLDHLYEQIKAGTVKALPLIVKADVHGSVEALTKTLESLPSDRVKTKVIHSGSGAITETDVLLASASNAIIIGYNVRPQRSAQELADKEKVEIRLHAVIYDITNQIKSAMVGLLEPESKEVYLGRAEVRQCFKVPKIGLIAGCMVSDGVINRSADVRLLRDNVVIFTGKTGSLKRFKNDTTEVKAGYECGIGLANFNDVKVGDIIEAFRIDKVAAKSL